jgi:integrase
MSLQLTETLKVLLTERKKETLKKGWGEVPSWVFTSATGTMIDPDNFRHRVWAKLPAKAELRQIRIHDLRHTFASLLIQQGESLAYVKDQMGHHSIRVTVDVYGHLVPGGDKTAVDKLDDLTTEKLEENPEPSRDNPQPIRNRKRAS